MAWPRKNAFCIIVLDSHILFTFCASRTSRSNVKKGVKFQQNHRIRFLVKIFINSFHQYRKSTLWMAINWEARRRRILPTENVHQQSNISFQGFIKSIIFIYITYLVARYKFVFNRIPVFTLDKLYIISLNVICVYNIIQW